MAGWMGYRNCHRSIHLSVSGFTYNIGNSLLQVGDQWVLMRVRALALQLLRCMYVYAIDFHRTSEWTIAANVCGWYSDTRQFPLSQRRGQARSREIQVIPPRQQMPSILSDSFNTFLTRSLGFLASCAPYWVESEWQYWICMSLYR